VSIQNLDGLHRAIGEHLAKHKKALNGSEIRFLRKQMDISQDQLAEILAVTDQTVARWEKQETEITGPAELLLRVIYLTEILEHVNPRELAAKLRELDSGPKDRQVFQSTSEGWQAAA
jgi:DNA-binding transcriptional regulator YiaG